MLKRILPALLVLLAILVLVACGDDDDETPDGDPSASGSPAPGVSIGASAGAVRESVTFMAGFKPQANLPFVGVYVAQEKGFFEEENLDVDIQHVATPGDNFRLLATGEVQFSTADATALLEKWVSDPVLPVVSIALVGQTGQQGFAVLEDSGIAAPADWAGKTVGYKGSAVTPDYLAIVAANGVDRSTITEVKVGFEPQLLTEGAVDIFPVFLSNEPDTLRRLGFETTLFTAADYGAPTLGLTYVAMEDYLVDNAEVARRFVRAAMRGIEYADDNRDEAIDIVMEYAPQEDPAHQRYMLDIELDQSRVGLGAGVDTGTQIIEQWQLLHDYLIQYGGLAAPIEDVNRVFRAGLLE